MTRVDRIFQRKFCLIAKIRYIKHVIGKFYVGNAIYHLTTPFNTLIISSFPCCPYLKQIMDRNGTGVYWMPNDLFQYGWNIQNLA